MNKLLSEMTNKNFIFACLDLLNNSRKLDEKVINKLLDRDYCSLNFSCPFAILVEVPKFSEISPDYYNDNSGHRRYYPNRYFIDEKAFIVTNHWYGPEKSNPDNRTPFMNWVLNLLE